MRLVLDQFSRILIDAGVANAVLLSLVVVLMVFTRQPARRVMLAQAGVYAALFMLPLVVFTPLPRLYPIDWMTRQGVMPPPFLPRSSEYATGDLLGQRIRARIDVVGRRGHADVEWPAGEPWIRGLALFHLAGTTIGIGWFGLGLWGFQRVLRRSNEPSIATQRIFSELIADLDRPTPPPDLRVSTWLQGPVLGGLIHPCILVPRRLDAEGADPASVRLILLHELAHADRGDVWFSALAGVAQALWFFLPHLWWLRSQLRIDQEFLADRKAAGPTGDSTVYARWLVGLASARSPGEVATQRPVETEAVAEAGESSGIRWWKGGFKSPLLQRVAMLLYCPFRLEEHAPNWLMIVLPVMLAAAAVGLSSCRLLAPRDPSTLLRNPRADAPVVSSFHVPQLVLVPGGGTAVLPLALPPRFSLSADLYANPRALAQIRLAGRPLKPSPTDDAADSAPEWHSVVMTRDANRLLVRVDGQTIVHEQDYFETETNGPQWLTIESPRDDTAVFRDVLVSW